MRLTLSWGGGICLLPPSPHEPVQFVHLEFQLFAPPPLYPVFFQPGTPFRQLRHVPIEKLVFILHERVATYKL